MQVNNSQEMTKVVSNCSSELNLTNKINTNFSVPVVGYKGVIPLVVSYNYLEKRKTIIRMIFEIAKELSIFITVRLVQFTADELCDYYEALRSLKKSDNRMTTIINNNSKKSEPALKRVNKLNASKKKKPASLSYFIDSSDTDSKDLVDEVRGVKRIQFNSKDGYSSDEGIQIVVQNKRPYCSINGKTVDLKILGSQGDLVEVGIPIDQYNSLVKSVDSRVVFEEEKKKKKEKKKNKKGKHEKVETVIDGSRKKLPESFLLKINASQTRYRLAYDHCGQLYDINSKKYGQLEIKGDDQSRKISFSPTSSYIGCSPGEDGYCWSKLFVGDFYRTMFQYHKYVTRDMVTYWLTHFDEFRQNLDMNSKYSWLIEFNSEGQEIFHINKVNLAGLTSIDIFNLILSTFGATNESGQAMFVQILNGQVSLCYVV
jgi:hypothetical protein